jgi:hypothetical protein
MAIFLFFFAFLAQAQTSGGDVPVPLITDPGLSTRCRELLLERNDKVKIRQRIADLHRRNQNLLNKVPPQRTAMKARLSANAITVRNELYLATMQVQNLEENIVRSGCPGINL